LLNADNIVYWWRQATKAVRLQYYTWCNN